MATPRAQAELEEFRRLFGRPAQATLLYHWARLIELVYACERCLELLADDRIIDPAVRQPARPGAGRGIGHVTRLSAGLDTKVSERLAIEFELAYQFNILASFAVPPTPPGSYDFHTLSLTAGIWYGR